MPAFALKARGYLFQAAGHRLIDRWRRQDRAEHIPLDQLGEADQLILDDPDAPVRASRLADDLAKVLAELPPKCREAFVLNRIEGWTQAEVAAHMGAVQEYESSAMSCAPLNTCATGLREHNP